MNFYDLKKKRKLLSIQSSYQLTFSTLPYQSNLLLPDFERLMSSLHSLPLLPQQRSTSPLSSL